MTASGDGRAFRYEGRGHFILVNSNRTLLSNWFVVSLPDCGSYWLWPGLRKWRVIKRPCTPLSISFSQRCLMKIPVTGVSPDSDGRSLAVVADQNRYVDWKAVGLGADILLHLGGEVVGLGPIFELIVIPEIHFTQPVWVGAATPVVPPASERRRRRTAIGAAGVIDIIVRQVGNFRAKLDVPDFMPHGPIVDPLSEEHCGRA